MSRLQTNEQALHQTGRIKGLDQGGDDGILGLEQSRG